MQYFGIIELILVFGAFMAFCIWQLRSLNRIDAEEATKKEKFEEDE